MKHFAVAILIALFLPLVSPAQVGCSGGIASCLGTPTGTGVVVLQTSPLLLGNVGIGTAAGSYLLDVNNPTVSANVLRVKPLTGSASGTVTLDVQSGSGATSYLKVTNGSGATIGTTLFATSLTAESGTKAALCIDTSTSEVEQNTGVATCTVSSLKYKDRVRDLTCADVTTIVSALRPGIFQEKGGTDQRFGFAAEEVYAVEPRLVYLEPAPDLTKPLPLNLSSSDPLKNPRGVDYERMSAVVVKYEQCLDARLTAAGIK